MPRLRDFSAVAPFTLEELVDCANRVLAHRPRLLVSVRTLRYYISEGVVSKPIGSTRYARYTMEHFGQVVATRCRQDQGESLEETKKWLSGFQGNTDALIESAEAILERVSESTDQDRPIFRAGEPAVPRLAPKLHAAPEVAAKARSTRFVPTSSSPPVQPTPRTVVRYDLGLGIVLEVPEGLSLADALLAVMKLDSVGG